MTRDATGARVAALTGVPTRVLGGSLTRDATGIPRRIGTWFRRGRRRACTAIIPRVTLEMIS